MGLIISRRIFDEFFALLLTIFLPQQSGHALPKPHTVHILVEILSYKSPFLQILPINGLQPRCGRAFPQFFEIQLAQDAQDRMWQGIGPFDFPEWTWPS
jgi:hypothetical protein